MQKNNWLRLGMAGIILSGLGAGTVLQGCGDDDVTPLDAGADTAPTNTTTATGTGTVPDSSVPDTFVPPVPESQKIIFVHAGNWMGTEFETGVGPDSATNGSVRLCLRAGDVGNNPFLPVPALPNAPSNLPLPDGGTTPFAGLLRGTGGVLPARTDFSSTRLEGFAMNARILAQKAASLPDAAARTKFLNTPCGDLFSKGLDGDASVPTDGGANLREGIDYIRVGVIEKGTFAPDSTYVVTVQGCGAGYAEQAGVTTEMVAAKCGASYASATGNLKLKVQKVDRGAVGATELGAQFIQATTGTATVPVNPGVLPGGGVDGGADAAAFKAFSTTPPVAYDAPITPLVKLAGVSLTADALTVNPQAPVPPYSFASSIAATAGKEPVTLGKGHVFVLVGEAAVLADPNTPNNVKLHFLAFPTNPVVPPLTQ